MSIDQKLFWNFISYLYIIFPIKVCLVFIDENHRHIILETDDDVSRPRDSFVAGLLEIGKEGGFKLYLRECDVAIDRNTTLSAF